MNIEDEAMQRFQDASLMRDEYDYEVDCNREWLGIVDDSPLTFGDAAWMVVEFLGISTIVLGFCVIFGFACGVI